MLFNAGILTSDVSIPAAISPVDLMHKHTRAET